MKKIAFILLLLLPLLSGCGIYSFTGGGFSPEVKTASVEFFPNRAELVVPGLSQTFTEALKDKLQREARINLAEEEGDVRFSGYINRYFTNPVGLQSGIEGSSQTQLTIEVHVVFENTKNPSENFEQKFSQFETFDNTQTLEQVQDELIPVIMEQLIQTIYNRAVINW